MEIPVFYNPAMVVRSMEGPFPRKPAEVVSDWVGSLSVRVMGFEPLGVEDFCLAHDRAHVMGILDLSIANGMDAKEQDMADTLGWTTGSFYAAASHALEHGVAASPTSGLHHAGHAFSWGFCAFNGLLISAIKLFEQGWASKIFYRLSSLPSEPWRPNL